MDRGRGVFERSHSKTAESSLHQRGVVPCVVTLAGVFEGVRLLGTEQPAEAEGTPKPYTVNTRCVPREGAATSDRAAPPPQ